MSSRQPVSVILGRDTDHVIVKSLLTAVRESSGFADVVRAVHVRGLGYGYEQPEQRSEVIVSEVASLLTQLVNLHEVSLHPRRSQESPNIIVEVLRQLSLFQQVNLRDYNICSLDLGWSQYLWGKIGLYREIHNAIEELFPALTSLRMPACGPSEGYAFSLDYSTQISSPRPRTICLDCVGDLSSLGDWLEWMFASGRMHHLILKLDPSPLSLPGKKFLGAIARVGRCLRSLCIHLMDPTYQPGFWEGGIVESWTQLLHLHLQWAAIAPSVIDYPRSQKSWAFFLFSVTPTPEPVARSYGENISSRLPPSAALKMLEISLFPEDCGDEFATRLVGMASLLTNIPRLQSLRNLRILRIWLVQDSQLAFRSNGRRRKLVKNELALKLVPLCRMRRIALSIVSTPCDTCFE